MILTYTLNEGEILLIVKSVFYEILKQSDLNLEKENFKVEYIEKNINVRLLIDDNFVKSTLPKTKNKKRGKKI